ncbi:DUF695 domain-containing protein [Falsiporphyromonas endometrii]|uniref:DUF695 domain-containing protein n=1 Tax=Falsiporphyromonas endometrii TaxID=1387297 RepID=A0ABV9K5G1_9PORP
MQLSDEWFTVLSQDDNERLIYVNGRINLDKARKSGKYNIRIELTLPYKGDSSGMPSKEDAILIEQIHQALVPLIEQRGCGILTGNHIGCDHKYWVFYVKDEKIFQEKLNEALNDFELLPLEIECDYDPEWEEYLDMLSMRIKDSQNR